MMSAVSFEIAPAAALSADVRAEIISLCEAAYYDDFSRLFDELRDSTHVLARDVDGKLLSHAEWVPRWLQPGGHPLLRTAYVEAVATAPEHRRRGLATAVLRHAAEALHAGGDWELGALSPSDAAFYTPLGWELWRGPLAIRRGDAIEATVTGEQVMILRLPRTPATLRVTELLTAEWRSGEVW